MTTWLCGVERRWTMAAPSCFVTTFLRNTENELPADTEQCPPRALALGLDHCDFIAAMAPKPVDPPGQGDGLLRRPRQRAGVRAAAAALRPARAGRRTSASSSGRATTATPRRAARRCTAGSTARPASATHAAEPNLTIEKDETLWCAPNGQVCELDSRPIYSFTAETAKALAGKRPQEFTLAQLRGQVRQLLRLPESRETSAPSIASCATGGRAGIRSRGGRPTWSRPSRASRRWCIAWAASSCCPGRTPDSSRAILYVAHQSSDAELREEPLIARADQGRAEHRVLHRATSAASASPGPTPATRTPSSTSTAATTSTPSTRSCWTVRTSGNGPTTCCACWTGSRSIGHDEVHLVGQGLGRAAGDVRRRAVRPGRAGDAQERADLLPGDRRIEGLRLAALDARAERAVGVRSAGLLPGRCRRRTSHRSNPGAPMPNRVLDRRSSLRAGEFPYGGYAYHAMPSNTQTSGILVGSGCPFRLRWRCRNGRP